MSSAAANTDDIELAAAVSPSDKATSKTKVPRRIIHCSDGVVEEFSTDDEDDEDENDTLHDESAPPATTVVNPQRLSWLPWVVHYTVFAGKGIFKYCDHYGEKIAWFLGITSPRYYYEIEDFKRTQEEEEEEARKNKLETVGWMEDGDGGTTDSEPIKSEPAS